MRTVSTPRQPISVKMPKHLADQLRQLAERNSRTVSGEIRHLVKQAVQQREMKQVA